MTRLSAGRPTGRTIPLALVAGAGLCACEHPLPPANPSPLQSAAEHFDVPVSVLGGLQRKADALARSGPPSTTPPDAALAEVQILAEALRRLEAAPGGRERKAP